MLSKNEITPTLNQLITGFMGRSAFFRFWQPGQVDAGMAGRFLLSFDALVKSFPGLIAAGAARAKDEASRAVLAVNLYQECGEGDVSRTHHAIYRRFLSTAGLDLTKVTENSFAIEWRDRLSDYILQASHEEALGALAAGEFLAQPALGGIYPILKAHYPQADQEYFTKHLDLETEHVAEITKLIAQSTNGNGDFQEVVKGFKFGLSVWEVYFNHLAEHLKSNTIFATDEHG